MGAWFWAELCGGCWRVESWDPPAPACSRQGPLGQALQVCLKPGVGVCGGAWGVRLGCWAPLWGSAGVPALQPGTAYQLASMCDPRALAVCQTVSPCLPAAGHWQ